MDHRQRFRTINLTATCGDMNATIPFLKGALAACGGRICAGGVETEHIRTIEFECKLIALEDAYCVLVLSGLHLTRQSHYAICAFYQFLRTQLASGSLLLSFSVLVLDSDSDPGIHGSHYPTAQC